MSFFDDSVETAKDVFGSAVKRTTEAVEIQKIKFEISKVHSQLNDAFASLGRINYAEINKIAVDEEKRDEIINEINEMQSKIKDLKKQLYDARKTKICKICGRANANDAQYCTRCGEEL